MRQRLRKSLNIPDKTKVRFFAKVALPDNNKCEIWTGQRNRQGYGRIKIKRRRYTASRVAWIIAHGPIPDGMFVLHKCDNPPCVNAVDHMFLGTHLDNARDRDAKGRTAIRQGEKNAASKLSSGQILAIRFDPRLPRVIAAEYGMSVEPVRRIKRRKAWAHVALDIETMRAI